MFYLNFITKSSTKDWGGAESARNIQKNCIRVYNGKQLVYNVILTY